MRFRLVVFIWVLLSMTSVSWAQLIIEVTKYPPLLPSTPGLFIAGDFNNWNPGDPAYILKKQPNGTYSITLPDSLSHFEYKFTQGSWMTVEGNANGLSRPNRIYDRNTEKTPSHIQTTIDNWEQKPAYRFIVTEIPANTPHDAQLFISGNFNKWHAGDPTLRLQKQVDGTYRVTVYSDLDRLEFKFTRGDWDSVEGKESGKARPNRVIFRHENIDNKAIDVQILSWEDLSGTFNFYSIYDLLLLFSAFQGLLLLIAIPTIQNYNQAANRLLLVLLGLSSFCIAMRVIGSYRDVAQAYTKMLLLPDFILFTYAPLFYLYIQRLLYRPGRALRTWYYHFIPAGVQALVYLPFFLTRGKQFQLDVVNLDWTIRLLFLGSGFLGLLFNSWYWVKCRRVIQHYQREYETSHSFEHNIHYLYTVQSIQAICLILWTAFFVIIGISQLFAFDVLTNAAGFADAIWLVFSTITYFLGYYAIHQPEIFKVHISAEPATLFNTPPVQSLAAAVPENPTDQPAAGALPDTVQESSSPALDTAPPKAEPIPDNELTVLKEQVETYLLRHKPYSNPNLTINELASKLKMQPYLLSKVINEGFDKNFFDFINYYRVEELKKRLEDPRFKHYTLLSQAFEVGFNSKTAFNRAFKKITQQTPSEYLSAVREAA